jgi:APA family basic amino acid/polyamine antiporter
MPDPAMTSADTAGRRPDKPAAPSPPESNQASEPSMPAEFGVATAAFVVVASMVGVGVLTTSGYTVAAVGSNQLMLVLWVVGGVAALCAALTLAELSAALPKVGGEYVILLEAYGPLMAFLSGWVSFLLGFAAPIAAAADASAAYLLAPVRLTGRTATMAEGGLASLAILVFAAIHTAGRSGTVRVQVSITLLKLALLAWFVVAGLAVGWQHAGNLYDRPALDFSIVEAMAFSFVYITYGYFGWNAASFLAGEVRDPGRTLPRAIVLGTAAVILLYVGVNVVYALALPAADIQSLAHAEGSNAVKPIAELATARLFGPGWARRVSVAAGLMMLSSLSAYVLTGPRVVFAMARVGQFPAIAGRLSSRYRTPAIATWLLAGLSLVLLWTGSFKSIVIYASVGMALFSMFTIGAVYVLRWRRPDLPRPFRTPGYPIVPAVYLVASALLIIAVFRKDRESALTAAWSVVSILAGVPAYYLWHLFKRPPAPREMPPDA